MSRRKTLDIASMQFYKFDKWLLAEESLKKLSPTAKLLYMVIKDREEISLKNADKFTDKEGYLFQYFDQVKAGELLGISKNAVIKAKDIDTVVTGRVTGHPVQVIKNRLAREFLKLEASNVSAEKLEELGRGALRRAVKDGDVDNSSLMAGQISGMVSKKQSVKEIIEEIFNEYEELRKAL